MFLLKTHISPRNDKCDRPSAKPKRSSNQPLKLQLAQIIQALSERRQWMCVWATPWNFFLVTYRRLNSIMHMKT